MHLLKPLIPIFIIIVTGCASDPFGDITMPITKAYASPQSGSRARVRISTDGAVRLAVNTNCPKWNDPSSGVALVAPDAGPLLTKENNGKFVGMPGRASSTLANTELYIPAGKPLLLHYMKQQQTSMTGVAVCNGLFSFIPKEDGNYLAVFSQYQGGNKCLRTVIDLNNKEIPVENLSDNGPCHK